MHHVINLKRNKLYWIRGRDLQAASRNLPYRRIDIGALVAGELTRNPPGRHLSLEIDDFLRTTLRQHISAQDKQDDQEPTNRGLILDNLGILLEPELGLNPVKLFLELSIDAVLILVWDHAILDGTRFVWDESAPDYGFVFPSQTITNMEITDEVPRTDQL